MVAGTWNLVMKAPMGKINATLILAEDNGILTGTLDDGKSGPTEITEGTVNGNEFCFNVMMTTPFGKLAIQCTGTVEADAMSGTAKAKLIALLFNGTRA